MKHLYVSILLALCGFMVTAHAEESPCDAPCKHNAQIYLGNNCQYTLTKEDVLHYPPPGCHYDITVYNAQGHPIGNTVNASHVGQTLNVKVTKGSWFCWGSIVVHGSGHGGGPVAVCDQNTVVTLGSDGTARVYWQTIDDGSYVSCGGSIASIQVRRKHPGWCPPGVIDDTQFRDFVEFCCEDAGQTVKVVLRVTDHYGNFNECYVNVHVQDYSVPTIHCPPDITVSCDKYIDLNDLSEFGTVRMNQHDIQPIHVDDPYYGGFKGYDGYVGGGGCSGHNLWVQEHVTSDLDCGQGVIYRKFKIENTYISCTQKIVIRNPHYNSGSQIVWPDDVVIDDCDTDNTDPSVTGRPITPVDDCAIYATSYRDEVFEAADGACFKILRRWAVIDWCTYTPGGHGSGHGGGYGGGYGGGHGHQVQTGRWEYTQVIKLNGSGGPEFISCDDITFCSPDAIGCSGKADLFGNAQDDCTPEDQLGYHWSIDLNNDNVGPLAGGVDIRGEGRDASDYYPYGTHRIFWRVEDLCGNYNTCTFLFTVEDCKKPSPVCYGGISTVVMPATGMIELNARHFDASSFDNCTENEDLIFSFSPDVTETTRIFDCNNIGTNEVEVWVTDENGQQQYCTSFLVIDDNDDVCPDTPMALVTGHVVDFSGTGLEGNQVELLTDINIATIQTTNDNGEFFFGSFAPIGLQEVEVEVRRDDDPLNGVSVLDLLLMQRHILDVQPLDESWKHIAADVNNDGSIDGRDLLATREVMMDQEDGFGGASAWTFVNTEDLNTPNMEASDRFTVYMSTDLPSEIDVMGIKIADLNGDADMYLTRGSSVMEAQDRFVEQGTSYDLNMKVLSNPLLEGLDLRLPINTAFAEITSVMDGQGRELDFQLTDGELRVLELQKWSPEDLHQLTIQLKALQTGWVSEFVQGRATSIGMVAFEDDSETNLRLRWTQDEAQQDANVQARVLPNPFQDQADVIIKNTDLEEGSVQVINNAGQVLFQREIFGDEHIVRVQLDRAVVPHAGLYFVQVQLGDRQEVIKVVRQ